MAYSDINIDKQSLCLILQIYLLSRNITRNVGKKGS